MFWIQGYGTNRNNPGYKLFYAEFKNDIALLPTNKKEGTQTNGETVTNKLCALGSECICIENSLKYILTTSGWTNFAIKTCSLAEVATNEEASEYLEV